MNVVLTVTPNFDKSDVRFYPLNVQSELQIDNKSDAIERIFYFFVSFEDP